MNDPTTENRSGPPESDRRESGQVEPAAPDPSGADDATVLSADKLPLEGSHPQTSDLGRLLEGQKLNHFQLDAFVGGGGMGAVFRGTDTALGRTVAVKVLLQQYSDDEETTQRFQNEAQSTARLDHENIARVYYVGQDRGWHYIVLEFVEGDNLRDLVYRSGPLDLEATVRYSLQIADALEHASSRDVVHRDIKPSNVLITKNGRVKLVDMGLARLHHVDNSQEDLTATGVTLGTFDYISPEQARDPRSADVRSDLYSLGCTIFFMLTANPPFPEGTVLQKLLQHQGDAPPNPKKVRPDLPAAFCDIIAKLLAKSPRDRYQNPLELSADLLLLANQLDLRPERHSSVVMRPRGLKSSWSSRHLPWIVPTGLLILIGLFIHYTAQPSDPVPSPQLTTNGGVAFDEFTSPAPPLDVGDTRKPEDTDFSASRPGPVPSIPPSGDAAKLTEGESDNVPDQETINLGGVPTLPPRESKSVNNLEGSLRVGGPSERGAFVSVAEACRKATSGSVIELDYDGRLEKPEPPVLLAQRKLTIRASEGRQPIIYFRPLGPDRALYPRSMITLAGGSLTLVNVHLELEIPPHARSEGWTLFEAVLADQLRLERCTLTIRNAGGDFSAMYRNVSFFNIQSPPGKDESLDEDSLPVPPRIQIELRDCIVRGEAVLLRGNALFSAEIQWENGLLATTERFVEIDGQLSPPPDDQQLTIDLKHVTAVMDQGFCLMKSNDDHRRLSATRIDCTDSILITDNTPLIQQSGPETEEDFRALLTWNADRCFYENFKVFWEIDSSENSSIIQWDWQQWHRFWEPAQESGERPAPVLWGRRSQDVGPKSNHRTSDYLLLASEENPARSAASDGTSDAGLQYSALPKVPPPPKGSNQRPWSPTDDLPPSGAD